MSPARQPLVPVESVAVHAATVVGLARFLNPEVPWVWILGHMPRTTVEWWQVEVPIDAAGYRTSAEIRLLSYDLQMPTAQFLDVSVSFDQSGLSLVQSRKRMPNTLQFDRVENSERHRILRLNGAFLMIDLPHANETAVVSCFEPGYLRNFLGT